MGNHGGATGNRPAPAPAMARRSGASARADRVAAAVEGLAARSNGPAAPPESLDRQIAALRRAVASARAGRQAGANAGASAPKAPSPPKPTAAQKAAQATRARHAAAIAYQIEHPDQAEVRPADLPTTADGRPDVRPQAGFDGEGFRSDPFASAGAQARTLQSIYGDRQLAAVLSTRSHDYLARAAREMGVAPSRDKAETLSRLVAHMTSGRYSANIPVPADAPARAARTPGEEAARVAARIARAEGRATPSRQAPAARAALTPRALTPAEHEAWTGVSLGRSNVTARLNPYFTAARYGSDHVRAALEGYSMRALRQAATVVAHFNPGTKPAGGGRSRQALLDYVAEGVANGPSPAPFNADELPIWGK